MGENRQTNTQLTPVIKEFGELSIVNIHNEDGDGVDNGWYECQHRRPRAVLSQVVPVIKGCHKNIKRFV